MFRKLSLSVFLIFSGDAGARLFSFIATVHIARVLGKEYFGMITIGIAVLGYATWFADMGLKTLGIREIAKSPEQRAFKFEELFQLRILLAAAIFILAQILLTLIPVDAVMLLTLRLFLLLLFVDAVLPEWYYKGIRRYLPLAISGWLTGLIYVMTVFTGITEAAHVYRIPLFYALSYLPAIAIFPLWKRKKDLFFSVIPTFSRYGRILKQSLAIGLSSIITQVVQLLPPILLGAFYSTAAAGIYGAAMKIVGIAMIVDRIFVALFLPTITRLRGAPQQQISQFLTLLLKLIIIGGFSVSTVISICAPHIIQLVYGSGYQESQELLMILAWFLLPTLLNSVFVYTLIAMGHEKLYFQSILKSSILTVFVLTIFTWWGGCSGTAAGVLFSEIIIIYFIYNVFKQFFPIHFLKSFLLPGLLSLGLIFGARYLNIQQLWFAPLLWLCYIGGSFLLKEIRLQDIRLLMRQCTTV